MKIAPSVSMRAKGLAGPRPARAIAATFRACLFLRNAFATAELDDQPRAPSVDGKNEGPRALGRGQDRPRGVTAAVRRTGPPQ